jgi:hypothetical protein
MGVLIGILFSAFASQAHSPSNYFDDGTWTTYFTDLKLESHFFGSPYRSSHFVVQDILNIDVVFGNLSFRTAKFIELTFSASACR